MLKTLIMTAIVFLFLVGGSGGANKKINEIYCTCGTCTSLAIKCGCPTAVADLKKHGYTIKDIKKYFKIQKGEII